MTNFTYKFQWVVSFLLCCMVTFSSVMQNDESNTINIISLVTNHYCIYVGSNTNLTKALRLSHRKHYFLYQVSLRTAWCDIWFDVFNSVHVHAELISIKLWIHTLMLINKFWAIIDFTMFVERLHWEYKTV